MTVSAYWCVTLSLTRGKHNWSALKSRAAHAWLGAEASGGRIQVVFPGAGTDQMLPALTAMYCTLHMVTGTSLMETISAVAVQEGGSEPRPRACRTIKHWLLLFDPQNSDFFSGPSALLDKEVIFLVPLLLGSPLPPELAQVMSLVLCSSVPLYMCWRRISSQGEP